MTLNALQVLPLVQCWATSTVKLQDLLPFEQTPDEYDQDEALAELDAVQQRMEQRLKAQEKANATGTSHG